MQKQPFHANFKLFSTFFYTALKAIVAINCTNFDHIPQHIIISHAVFTVNKPKEIQNFVINLYVNFKKEINPSKTYS